MVEGLALDLQRIRRDAPALGLAGAAAGVKAGLNIVYCHVARVVCPVAIRILAPARDEALVQAAGQRP